MEELNLCNYRSHDDETIGKYDDMNVLTDASYNAVVNWILSHHKPFDTVTIYEYLYRNGMRLHEVHTFGTDYEYMEARTCTSSNYDACSFNCVFSGLVARLAKKSKKYKYLYDIKCKDTIELKEMSLNGEDLKFLGDEFEGSVTIKIVAPTYYPFRRCGCTGEYMYNAVQDSIDDK